MKEGKWPGSIIPVNHNHASNTSKAFGRYKDYKEPPSIRPILNKKGPTYFPGKMYDKNI